MGIHYLMGRDRNISFPFFWKKKKYGLVVVVDYNIIRPAKRDLIWTPCWRNGNKSDRMRHRGGRFSFFFFVFLMVQMERLQVLMSLCGDQMRAEEKSLGLPTIGSAHSFSMRLRPAIMTLIPPLVFF